MTDAFELADAEVRAWLFELAGHSDVLTVVEVALIEATGEAVRLAYWDDRENLPTLLAAFRSAVDPLRALVEEDRKAVAAAIRRMKPNTVEIGFGREMRVSPTATRTLRAMVRHARPARSPRRRESRGTRRVTRTVARRSSSKSPPGESDPPSRPRRLDGGGENSRDSKLNVCWQRALDLNVEELETLAVLASTRAVWLGRWGVAA